MKHLLAMSSAQGSNHPFIRLQLTSNEPHSLTLLFLVLHTKLRKGVWDRCPPSLCQFVTKTAHSKTLTNDYTEYKVHEDRHEDHVEPGSKPSKCCE